MKFQLTYKLFGRSAILVEWPANISQEIIQDIISFERQVKEIDSILDTIIAYNSLLIRYQNPIIDKELTISQLKKIYAASSYLIKQDQFLWQIPVCYDVSFGIDLEEIANKKKCSVAEIIRLHTEGDYLVYFIGFQPGFLYLGGLHQTLHVSRKSNPRLRVDKGSVAIGGIQTGIYPQNSSGGWNIIGKSPLNFFDINASEPCFAKPGDRIKFVAVDIHTFYQIEREVANQKFRIKKSVL
ncbi:5-oxoprolinase subunit PxpB [Flavobacteriaceae bacterium]|nr:5-oxoprolinase subunit PxpB [Flavobacteriaceae bacterium]MDB4559773.1 5-oxoprolinase subunit PxpB [Flavobacteriaceae bacterium]MDC1168049.1 5-oxoprolinase subunit PxpB [Flavobacteriaceae bacterium]